MGDDGWYYCKRVLIYMVLFVIGLSLLLYSE